MGAASETGCKCLVAWKNECDSKREGKFPNRTQFTKFAQAKGMLVSYKDTKQCLEEFRTWPVAKQYGENGGANGSSVHTGKERTFSQALEGRLAHMQQASSPAEAAVEQETVYFRCSRCDGIWDDHTVWLRHNDEVHDGRATMGMAAQNFGSMDMQGDFK